MGAARCCENGIKKDLPSDGLVVKAQGLPVLSRVAEIKDRDRLDYTFGDKVRRSEVLCT